MPNEAEDGKQVTEGLGVVVMQEGDAEQDALPVMAAAKTWPWLR